MTTKDKKSILVITIPILLGIGVLIFNISLKVKLEFTEEDYAYMYNDIVNSYGDGEEFHVVDIKERYIEESLLSVEGIEITYIGYFDSQEDMYAIGYGRYFEDKPQGKAGDIFRIAVNTNYSKDEFFNSDGGNKVDYR